MQMGLIKDENKNLQKDIIVPKEFTHSCAIGQTGCGKTSSYIYPNLEDRIKSNYSILAYDYKGKEHLNIKYFANKYNRLNDVIEIGKDWGQSINLIKYLTKADLENLLLDLFGRSEKDIFWSRSSANVCLAVFDVLKITDNLTKQINKIDPKFNVQKYLDDYVSSEFNPSYTFKSLMVQTRNIDKLKDFYENLSGIQNCFSLMCAELIKKDSQEIKNKKELEKKYISLYYELENLLQVCHKSNKTLDYLINNSNDNTSINSLIMCINAPLRNIASIECLNNDELDVIESLGKNKIAVINVKNFSDLILSAFNNSLFCELTKNSYKSNNSISIFIDEAQRILSEKFDVPVDVLRECRVELFLAFQNQELVIEKIGKNKFESLIKNIKNRYLFKNPSLYENYDLSKLETFEFYDDEKMNFKVYESNPIFVSSDESFEVEYSFQKINKIKERYQFSKNIRNSILVYDESLFLNSQMILRKKDGYEELVSIFDKSLLGNAKQKMNIHICTHLEVHRKKQKFIEASKRKEKESQEREEKKKKDRKKQEAKIHLLNQMNDENEIVAREKISKINDDFDFNDDLYDDFDETFIDFPEIMEGDVFYEEYLQYMEDKKDE